MDYTPEGKSMKKSIFLAVIVLAGCTNTQQEFCEQASSKLCGQCEMCGDYKACGLTRTSDRADCERRLQSVCAAYDAVYSAEAGRSCLARLDERKMCEEIAKGTPEACTKLF